MRQPSFPSTSAAVVPWEHFSAVCSCCGGHVHNRSIRDWLEDRAVVVSTPGLHHNLPRIGQDKY
eukprot:21837-Eustigmatos_ZCMA.PRE.1